MNAFDLAYLITGAALAGFLALFALTAFVEEKFRAFGISLILALLTGWLWFGVLGGDDAPRIAIYLMTGGAWVLAALFFLPLGRTTALRVGTIDDQVDERDVIFAREEYRPGTEKYDAYYARRPELKEVDDKIRALPELLAPGGRLHERVAANRTTFLFRKIEKLCEAVDGPVAESRRPILPAKATADLKAMALSLGAVKVGVAELNPKYVYSHVGRGPDPWGEPIALTHRYALVFTLEMDYFKVGRAPKLGITEESATQYLVGALASVKIAKHIRSLGYPARAHIAGSNYRIMLPPVACDAGLGELGRMGYLIAPDLGARVRLGAVTTDLALVPDKPITFGVQEFCEICKKCARSCPSGAIPRKGKITVRGVEKWQLDIEKCLHLWRVMGTDCGLCMKVCPFSHPRTFVHDVVRAGIRRSAFARRVSLWGDDLFYGRGRGWKK